MSISGIDSPHDQCQAQTTLRLALIALNWQLGWLPQWLDGCLEICYTSLRADSENRGLRVLAFSFSMARSECVDYVEKWKDSLLRFDIVENPFISKKTKGRFASESSSF